MNITNKKSYTSPTLKSYGQLEMLTGGTLSGVNDPGGSMSGGKTTGPGGRGRELMPRAPGKPGN